MALESRRRLVRAARRLRRKTSSARERNRDDGARRDYFNVCSAERNRLIGSMADQAKAYDQAILTLSASAIALSLTYVEKVAPEPAEPLLLGIAWTAFTLAVALMVASFVASQRAFRHEIEWVDRAWNAATSDEAPPVRAPNRYTHLLGVINALAGILFVIGLLSLVLFGVLNRPTRIHLKSQAACGERHERIA